MLCDPPFLSSQLNIESDMQALEHVSKPHNKPAKRGGKNHVVVVHMIAESDIDGR